MSQPARPRALIVDDDPDSLAALSDSVTSSGFEAIQASSLAAARKELDTQLIDVALIDLELPDGLGLELVEALDRQHRAEVMIITGHGSLDSAVDALRAGVIDYLTKPIELARVRRLLGKVRQSFEMRSQIEDLRGELRSLGRFGQMVGSSPQMQQVYDMIQRVAPTDTTVLITGETGTGKELVAQTVHALSRRASGVFVDVNCGAVSPTLIESELFGHEKGAFTGASRARSGIFERAQGGTLLLDEITEMPADLQVKLLRVLETSRLRRVGGDRDIAIDVRLIAATNRNPVEAADRGELRKDLLYRLNVFPIYVPPLRERGDDVRAIASELLARLNRQNQTDLSFTRSALDQLAAYSWPGNVRELRNVLERAFILASGERIESEHLPIPDVSAPALTPRASETGSGAAHVGRSIAELERELILATLEQLEGDKKAAAKMLGISLKTLYNRLNDYASR